MLFIAVLSFSFAACSDDDSDGGGTPEITGVKILSSDTVNYSYDKTYTKAGAGTMIAIMGKNLGTALHVYINDQEVTINPTMNTDHSIIVTIPTEAKGFKLSAFDSNIPDEIKVETTHGTATYAFKVTAPGPQLQRIEAKYPRSAGDTLKLHGLNLVDVEKIFITDVQAAALDTTTFDPENVPGNHTDVTDFFSISQDHRYNAATQSYTTYSLEGAIMPANAPDSGALVIQCAAGTTYMPYYRVPGKPVVLSVSNDMPQIGETFVITGREFIQVSSITYGDVTLTPDEFTVSASQDSIYVPFTKQPSGNVSTLTVTTPGGQANVERFYDRSTILTTFDNDDAVDEGWGPNASYIDAGNADGKYANIFVDKEYQQWWGTMIFFKKDWNGNNFTLSDNIPANASADDIYFAFNVYDSSDYNNGTFWGFLRYTLWPNSAAGQEGSAVDYQYDNFGWADYNAGVGEFPDGPMLQDFNGQYHKNQWYRAIVPIKKFPAYAKLATYGDVKNAGVSIFRIQDINQATAAGHIDARIDNVRIVYIPK